MGFFKLFLKWLCEVILASALAAVLAFLVIVFVVIFYFLKPPETVQAEEPLPKTATHRKLSPQDLPFSKRPEHQAFLSYLNQVEQMKAAMLKMDVPDLCEIICDEEQIGEDTDLFSFYQMHGEKAFADPEFRLRFERASFITELFRPNLRRKFFEVMDLDLKKWSEKERMAYAAGLEWFALPQAYHLTRKALELKEKDQVLTAIKKLREECTPKKIESLAQDCRRLHYE